MFWPSRSKMVSGRTVTVTWRSPAGPPLVPWSPSPRTMKVWPSSMPAGTLTVSFRFTRTRPLPPHFWQGFLMTLPVPPHREQGWRTCIIPRMLCLRTVT